MATFALMANITCNTITKRNAIYDKIETFLSGKPVWDRTTLEKGIDKDNLPSMSVTVRFNQRPNLDNLFDLAKTELNKLTGVKATFSKHICHHDEGNNQPCVFEEIAEVSR